MNTNTSEQAQQVSGTGEPRTVRSEELFAGQRVLWITHAGQLYRLLITRNDRLILQK
jgi:hemin uptake protein HemP